MTTKVTIEPSGHRIEVVSAEGQGPHLTSVLDADSPPRVFYVHSNLRIVSIREIGAND